MEIKVTYKAKQFIQQRKIKDVTFELKELDINGCCIGIAKEIEPVYEAPRDASGYKYINADGYHVFISRNIRILGPLTLTTEGVWKLRRLYLNGATVPI